MFNRNLYLGFYGINKVWEFSFMIEEIRWKMLLQVGKILDKYRRDKIGK